MKNHIKKLALILLFPLFAFTALHKYYISVTEVNYSAKDDALQIISRVFIDDMDAVLLERYDVVSKLATSEENPLAEKYIEKYFKSKFEVRLDDEIMNFTFIGKRFDGDMMVCYLEIPQSNFKNRKTISIQNEVLMDMFEDQQNILHFKVTKRKKSFVLIKENSIGLLKF